MVGLVTKIRAPELFERGPKTNEQYETVLEYCSSQEDLNPDNPFALHRRIGELVVCWCEIADIEARIWPEIDLIDAA